MTTGKWREPGVPHRGWKCVDVEDLVHRSRQKIQSSLAAHGTLPGFRRCQDTNRVNHLNASVH
jgi:hypothetical protein